MAAGHGADEHGAEEHSADERGVEERHAVEEHRAEEHGSGGHEASSFDDVEETDAGETRAGTPVGMSRRAWVLLVAAVGVIVIVLLVVSVTVLSGTVGRVRASSGPAHAASGGAPGQGTAMTSIPEPMRSATPQPTPSGGTTEPVSALATGDCLQTYGSPWASAYPVIGCDSPHIAQVLSVGTLPEGSDAVFPGAKAVASETFGLCSNHDLIDWNWVAVWNEDVLIDLRYPNTSAEWDAGQRSYYCFVYTYSHHELTGSAVPSGQ
jgi:hypothetical protein